MTRSTPPSTTVRRHGACTSARSASVRRFFIATVHVSLADQRHFVVVVYNLNQLSAAYVHLLFGRIRVELFRVRVNRIKSGFRDSIQRGRRRKESTQGSRPT